jgi:hypothetical protein
MGTQAKGQQAMSTPNALTRLKPIPTAYKGIEFRSRLEANVAQAMDGYGIQWLYEERGYDLDGVAYLPDFWCPKIRTFVEAKGILDAESVEKISLLSILANGLPRRIASEHYVAPASQPLFNERTGIHVVVLTRSDIRCGHYAPSLLGAFGDEGLAMGSKRIPGTVISAESKDNFAAHDFARLVRCSRCSAVFWQARYGWPGCLGCLQGTYPHGNGAAVRGVDQAATPIVPPPPGGAEARAAAAEASRQVRNHLAKYGSALSPEQRAKQEELAEKHERNAGGET